MKHIFVLNTLLLLAACSSTGDAGRVGGGYTMNEYQNVRISNQRVTGLAQEVTNRSDIVNYAIERGVVVASGTSGVQSLSTDGRYANSGSVKPGHSSNQSDRDKIPVFNKQFATAKNAFENMYKIYSNDFANMDINDIKSAYLIAGGDATDYTWDATLSDDDKADIQTYITGVAADVFNKFFEQDPENSNAWIIAEKAQNLGDIEMKMASGDDVLTFNLDEYGEIIGIDFADNELTRRNRTQSFVKTEKTSEYTDTTVAVVNGYGMANKLSYADFGKINMATTRDFVDETLANQFINKQELVYAGGYDMKNIDRADVTAMNTEMNFDGMAIGVVTGTDASTITVAGNATLNFKDGVETLGVNFAGGSTAVDNETKWYYMEIVNDGTDASITFKPQTPDIKEQYQLANMTENGKTVEDYNGFEIKYFGDNNTPTEFAGTATYTDDVENGVRLDTAFGGTLVVPSDVTQ